MRLGYLRGGLLGCLVAVHQVVNACSVDPCIALRVKEKGGAPPSLLSTAEAFRPLFELFNNDGQLTGIDVASQYTKKCTETSGHLSDIIATKSEPKWQMPVLCYCSANHSR